MERTILTCTAIFRLALTLTQARAEEIKVLMIGNSQCPLLIGNRLIENLATSDKGAPAIKVTCIKGVSTLKKHSEAGTESDTARAMIADGGWDFVVLQEIYNIQEPDMQPYARQFHKLINGSVAKTVFFSTASIISDYPQGFERLHRLRMVAGKELGARVVDASHAYFNYLGAHPSAERMESLFRPPHSPAPVPVLTVSGAAGAKAISLQ